MALAISRESFTFSGYTVFPTLQTGSFLILENGKIDHYSKRAANPTCHHPPDMVIIIKDLSTHYNVPGQPHITPPLAHQPRGRRRGCGLAPPPAWLVGEWRSNVRLTRNIIVCTKGWWEWPGRNGIMSNSPNDCMEALSCNIV